MARKDDVSSAHFKWLVAGRSRNQATTLRLYEIIEAHQYLLEGDIPFQDIAHQLVAIAFSLWRAVFLSDLTGDAVDQISDLKRFLQSLIAHNSVLYQTDVNAREWTFIYYLDNAVSRLGQLPDRILASEYKAAVSGTAKDDWSSAQAALEVAISNFASLIADHDPA